MAYVNLNSKKESAFSPGTGKLLAILSGITLFMVGLTIFQDFLESKRNSYTFYFSESLLFKTGWFLYVPILMILYKKLKNRPFNSFAKTITGITAAIAAHLLIMSGIATILAILFFQGQYDPLKFLFHTLTHDFYALVIVYVGFAWGYKLISARKPTYTGTKNKPAPDTLVINNGRDNVIINVDSIIQITSATPYVAIHLENKKYLHSETLKSMYEQLDHNIFVRVHKSTLVNLSKVSAFKSRLNGDYDLLLTDGNMTRLSRTYASDFKKRFNTGSSGQPINSSG